MSDTLDDPGYCATCAEISNPNDPHQPAVGFFLVAPAMGVNEGPEEPCVLALCFECAQERPTVAVGAVFALLTACEDMLEVGCSVRADSVIWKEMRTAVTLARGEA